MMKKDPDVPLSQIELMVNPKKDSQDVLTVDHLFILSPCLSALELSRNDWVLITVENIRPLTEYHNSPLPILDEAKLELIQAVVDITHGRHAPRTLLSQNEPNGSIIHIHGPPSVGKSSMIECIALRSRRPLLTLSPAEVGITYHSIRVNLRRWLSIGKRLKAVVLIANCDLIIRDPRIADSDLIIAFIQALKLYEGVIFLTTSKIDDIDDIDDALRPLVSLSISVPRINGKARSSIWAALENRIMAEEGIKLHQSAIKFLRFSGIHVSNWDVHEITRCYKIAIALAKKRTTQEQESTITVEDSHFKEAMNVVHESRRNFDERFPPPSRHHEMRSLPVSTLHEDVRGYAAVMAAPRVPKHPFIHSPMPPPMPPPTHPPTRPPTHHHPTHHHPTHHSTHHPIPHSPMSEPETNHGTSSSEASEQTLDNDSDLCIPHLNRIEWNAFSAAGTKELFRNATFYAMDVLEGEPLIKLHVDNRRQRKRQSFTHQTVSLDSIIPNATDHVRRVPNLLKPGKATLPERIRINAPAIIKAFSDICGEEISGPFLLFRPFRSLLYYEEEFHDLIRQQETLIQERPAQDIHTEEEDVENETKRRNALAGLEQLKCLVSFIDDILKKKQEYLKSDDCQFVPFDDVAMLFSPGETVISNDRKQVYLVMRVSCTRHRVKGQNENTPLCFLKDEGSVELDDDPIFVHCIYLDFDGKMIGPAHRTFTIFRYEDEREISSFPVFPLQHVKEDGLRERFIKRGKMFFEVAGIKHMHYTGLSLKTRDDIDSQVVIDFEEAINRHPQWKPMITSVLEQPLEKMAASVLDAYPGKAANGIVPNSNANAQVFSDAFSNAQKSMKRPCILQCCAGELKHHDEYIEDRRGEDCIVSQMNRTTPTRLPVTIVPQEFCNIVENNSLTDDEYLIMSYRVFGFVLHSRKWHELDMTHVFEVAVLGAGEGFDELVLPPGHGDMVKSMIRQHLRDRTLSSINRDKADVVRGKGRGLIILLHGVPGVGKTSTAECVADLFRRPLFQITSGDLGITAKEVEDALEENFSLASRWNSILLIDEADVFLAERTKEDFVRNSLVAVFLRMMEYYAGVLFLTTNRVGVFDEAFTSRIHISLYYPPLDRKSTLQIFQKNWDRINTRYKEAGRVIDIDTSDITEFAIDYFENNKEGRWNGRQIRNAFQSALALAELDALGTDDVLNESEHNKPVNLGRKSFDTVAEAYKGFTSYLKQVYGADFARRARENLWRFDAFGFPRMPNNLNTRLKVAEPIIPPHQGQWPGQGFPGYDPRNPQPYYPPRQHYPDSYDYSGQRPADPPPSTAHQYPDPRDRWGARPSTGDSNQ
ncbi:hypothetical protein F4803DRAFT_21152 [Xylaria telfairii]|nr:hypothetical protein F4803DRAFT_21152 [Xylaria telfairii]